MRFHLESADWLDKNIKDKLIEKVHLIQSTIFLSYGFGHVINIKLAFYALIISLNTTKCVKLFFYECCINILQLQFKTKVTADGFMVFRSDLTRSQQLNLADCLEKIRCVIREANYEKPPISEETLEKIRQRL